MNTRLRVFNGFVWHTFAMMRGKLQRYPVQRVQSCQRIVKQFNHRVPYIIQRKSG